MPPTQILISAGEASGDMYAARLATAAVDDILKKYATSNSAPDAYVIAGRLALSRSHQQVDLDAPSRQLGCYPE